MGFCAFFLVHVGQVVMAGWNNFRSMVSGYEVQIVDAEGQWLDAESGEKTGAAHE
jgi:hypothetical protein